MLPDIGMGYVYFEYADVLLLIGIGEPRVMVTHIDPWGGRKCLYTYEALMENTVEVWTNDTLEP